jgi:hypothetical protein
MVEIECNGVNYIPFGCVGLDLNHCGPLYFLLLFFIEDLCQCLVAFVIFVLYMVDQFGLSFLHTFAPWPCLCFAIYGKHVIPFQICSKGHSFIYDFTAMVNVCQD